MLIIQYLLSLAHNNNNYRSIQFLSRQDFITFVTSCPAPPTSCPTRSGISPAPTGHPNVLLISLHLNAAGDGTKWMNATGWSCYTCRGQTESDKLADCLYQAAIKNFPGKRIRTDDSDKDPDWEENFYILRKSLCPAVLTENFFQDCLSDVLFLHSKAGKQAVVDTHVEGIVEYIMAVC